MHSPLQPCPERILAQFDAAPKRTLISTRTNKPENDDASIPAPIEVKTDAASAIPSLNIHSGDSERSVRHEFATRVAPPATSSLPPSLSRLNRRQERASASPQRSRYAARPAIATPSRVDLHIAE